MVNMCKE